MVCVSGQVSWVGGLGWRAQLFGSVVCVHMDVLCACICMYMDVLHLHDCIFMIAFGYLAFACLNLRDCIFMIAFSGHGSSCGRCILHSTSRETTWLSARLSGADRHHDDIRGHFLPGADHRSLIARFVTRHNFFDFGGGAAHRALGLHVCTFLGCGVSWVTNARILEVQAMFERGAICRVMLRATGELISELCASLLVRIRCFFVDSATRG